jgi:hypothetical protein
MGWKCDIVSSSPSEIIQGAAIPPIRNLRYPPARPLLEGEQKHMEYFQVVCAREFSLFFELPAWENIILQSTLAEPALHHAALAIGALTSSRYHPDMRQTLPAMAFSVRNYSMAIQSLSLRLDGSSQSLELAVLASVVFTYIEFLLELDSQVELHIQAGRAILESLYKRYCGIHNQAGPKSQVGDLFPRYNQLASALFQLASQVEYCRTMAL